MVIWIVAFLLQSGQVPESVAEGRDKGGLREGMSPGGLSEWPSLKGDPFWKKACSKISFCFGMLEAFAMATLDAGSDQNMNAALLNWKKLSIGSGNRIRWSIGSFQGSCIEIYICTSNQVSGRLFRMSSVMRRN